VAPRIGVEYDFKIIDNIDEVVRHAQQAVSRLGTGKGAGGAFSEVTQAAASRVREITSSQNLPLGELARGLGGLRDLVRNTLQSAPQGFVRSSQAAGLAPSELLKMPQGYSLERVRATQKAIQEKRESAIATADVQQGLAGDPAYKKATAQAASARQRIAADVKGILLGDGQYQDATRRLASTRKAQSAKTASMLLGDTQYQTATQTLARVRKVQEKKTAEALLGDGGYQTATKSLARARVRQQALTAQGLLDDTGYQTATRSLARARLQQQAKTTAGLLGDTGYQTATKDLGRARQQQQAKTAQALLGDTQYQTATKNLAVTRQQQSAKTAGALLGDTDYQRATRSLARTRVQQDLKTQSTLLGDTDYQKATKDLARVRQVQQLKTASSLLDDGGYQTATKNLARVRVVQEGKTARALLDDTGYQTATKSLARTRQEQAAKSAAALLGDTGYQTATKNLSVTRAQQSAKSAAALLNDDLFQNATKNLAVTRAQQQAKTQGALAGDDTYRQATVDLAVARKTQAARTDQALADDPLARAAGVQAAKAKELLSGQTAQAKLDDPEYLAASKAATVAKANLAAATQQALAADPQYREATVRAAAAKEQQAANLRSGLAADQQYITATTRLAMAREEQAARVSLARQGERYTGTSRQELLAKGALAQRTETDLQAIATARETLAGDRKSIQIGAVRRYHESQVAAAMRVEERTIMRDMIRRGEVGGTRFQQLQARVSPSGRAPTEYATLGQAAVQKTITTGGYALGGMVAGGLLYGTIEAVKAASELQERFAALQGQMEALGAGDQFTSIREGIKGISNETGRSSAEISLFYSRVLGITESPEKALEETEAAMKLMTVAGIDMGTMIEEVVPITKAFGISMAELGDIAVGIRDKFGVAEESTLHFLGESAATMSDAGFKAEEAAVIGAAAANAIGKSSAVVGEQMAKVFGTIDQNQTKLLSVYQRSPDTAKLAEPLINAFAQGDTAGAFKAILASYGQLDAIQQESVVRLAGSRREWAMLSGIFRESGKLLYDINDASKLAAQGGDTLDKRFSQVSETLNRTLERIKQLFTNIVEGVVTSGLGGALGIIGKSLETILTIVNGLIAGFNKLNEATKFGPFDDGLLQFLTQMGFAVFLAIKAWQLFGGVRTQQARVSNLLTAAEERLGVAQTGTTGTTITQTEVIGLNTGVKNANIAATEGMAAAQAAPVAGAAAGTVTSAGGIILPAGTQAADDAAAAAAAAAAGAGGAGAARLGLWARLKALPGRALGGIKGLAGRQAIGAGSSFLGGGLVSTALTGAGAVVGGYMASDWARSAGREGGSFVTGGGPGLEAQSEALKKQVKTYSNERITQLAQDQRNVWDRFTDNFADKFFDVDMPQTVYQKEAYGRIGVQGAVDVRALQGAGKLGEFAQNVSEGNLAILEEWLKNSEGGEDFAEEMGFKDAAGNIKVTKEKLEEKLPEFEKRQKEGDEGASKALSWVHDVINSQNGMQELRDKIDNAFRDGSQADIAAAIELAGGMEAWLNMTYDPKGALESGEITPAQYLSQVDSQVALMKRKVAGQKDQEVAYRELNAKLREAQQFRNKLVMGEVERLTRFNKGSATPRGDELSNLLARLPQMDLQGQLDVLPQLYEKSQAAQDEMLDSIQDPWELYSKTVEGYTVDPKVRSLDIQDQIRKSTAATGVMGQLAANAGGDIETFTKIYADKAAERGITIKEAILQDLEEEKALMESIGMPTFQVDALIALVTGGGLDAILSPETVGGDERKAKRALLQSELKKTEAGIALRASTGARGARADAARNIETAQARLANLRQQKAAGIGGPDIDADIEEAQAEVNEANRSSADIALDTYEAMLGWAVVEANGDPVAEANAQLAIANAQAARILARTRDPLDPEYIKALQNVREIELRQAQNLRDIAASAFELEAFDRNRNVITAAQDKLTQALTAVDNAKGDNERNRALLQVKQAQREIDDAQEAELQSNAEYAMTLFNVNQDPVGAAQRAVQEAERQLALARSQNREKAELQRLMGDLAQKRSDAVDAAVGEQTYLIDFMLDMGEITQGQAIERLKVERDKYAYRSRKWMELQQKISSLEKSNGADLQFNLPANIAMPTLYEARRLNQTRQMGVGYMDNRTIALTFNVDGAQSPAETSTQIISALQGAMGGQIYSPGVPVGAMN
jgi:hypothetical protein